MHISIKDIILPKYYTSIEPDSDFEEEISVEMVVTQRYTLHIERKITNFGGISRAFPSLSNPFSCLGA